MSIQLSVDHIQYPDCSGQYRPTAFIKVSNLPPGSSNVVVNIGGWEGTVNNINGDSVIVPVSVPDGNYTVTISYDGPYEQYQNYYFTPDVSIPVTIHNPNPPCQTPSTKSNTNPSTTKYSSTPTNTRKTSNSSKVSSPIIGLAVSMIVIAGIGLLIEHRRKGGKK